MTTTVLLGAALMMVAPMATATPAQAVTHQVVVSAKKSTSVKVTTSNLNVRAGAGTKYRVIKSLKKGTKVTVVSTKGKWAELSAGGYVSTSYLKAAPASKPASKKPAAKPSAKKTNLPAAASSSKSKTMYTTGNLNVRAGEGTKHRVIKSLKKGSKVTVVSTKGKWAKLSTGGYVSTSYLKSSKPAAAKPAAKKPTSARAKQLAYANQIAKPYGAKVALVTNQCPGVANLLGCFGAGTPDTIYLTNRALDRSSAWVKYVTLHELSHRAMMKTCGTPIPPIVGKRVENVTDAYAHNLGAPKIKGTGMPKASDYAIAKKIKAGKCS
ncbi:SH3 domain-containing protein [Jonesiaceae bacterium BS-20]|uniref:SH3 domain-containing protein n=1 Tax=Jonesiaceae bacterium BS-20 TaxID=3120821 RepID=A0AAU7E0N6_9MICO